MKKLATIVVLIIVLANLAPSAVAQDRPCPEGTGPGGIVAGDYPPQNLTQEQRQWLFNVFGNTGEAPVGYGGERCGGNISQPSDVSFREMVCARGDTGPGGIHPGSYDPQQLTQEQRTWLYNQFGHSGDAPVGYGGETCPGQSGNLPSPNPAPPEQPSSGNADNIARACASGATGPGGIQPGSYDPQQLSPDQRTWLYNQFGHAGDAPVGYGGEGCPGQSGNWPVPNPGGGDQPSGGQQGSPSQPQQPGQEINQSQSTIQQQSPPVAHLDYGATGPIGDRSLHVIARNGLNIRSGPGTNYPIIGRLVFGGYFAITGGPDGNWYKIRFNNGEGWVSAQWVEVYLSNQGTSNPGPSVPSITPESSVDSGEAPESGNVINHARTVVNRVYGLYEGVEFAIDVIEGKATLVDGFCTAGGLLLSRDGNPAIDSLLESTDAKCVWLGAGSGLLAGNPIGLVPVLLYPEKYVDPWLDRVNAWATSYPLTCTFFPDAMICGH